MTWQGSEASQVFFKAEERASYQVNYLKGQNRAHWLQNHRPALALTQKNIYPGVDVRYSGKGEDLKYDIILAPGAHPETIQMHYDGLQDLYLEKGTLHLVTALGTLQEHIPLAYQMVRGKRRSVSCTYVLQGKTVSFQLGRYNPNVPLIIDPVLVFSTFSGSGDNNFGLSATYGKNGEAYGAGVNYGNRYPTTVGAFQGQFAGNTSNDVDVVISKFSANGSQLLYATYLGGQKVEVPHSIIEDRDGNLVIMGSTGSSNFPTTTDAYMETFQGGDPASNPVFLDFDQGVDIFITKLDSSGSSLVGSTFWGGVGNDGLNQALFHNYGDQSRGEVILTENGHVAIVSNTFSTDITMPQTNTTKSDSSQDAVVGVFSSDLKNLLWGSYLGGSEADAGYSIIYDRNTLFVTGSTSSRDLPGGNRDNYGGSTDGFLAVFQADNGTLLSNRFVGTPQRDQSFLVTVDRDGHPYLFGQTNGSIPISAGRYGNGNSRQFIMKLSNNGKSILWQTTIGSGQNKSDLVPTAFMVDRCFNIYLSGWNGNSNRISLFGNSLGDVRNMPTSDDALQSSTDGSDFYLMVLDKDATNLLYATYIGGSDDEHVDGGTSRFSPDGQIYQAVCTNCQGLGFPTTPGVYAPKSGARTCNMNIFKMDFEKIVQAKADVAATLAVDSICAGLRVTFNNNSSNANGYKWYFGNGDSSLSASPEVIYRTPGVYTITMIAIDTVCDLSDTLVFTLENDQVGKPQAQFSADFESCDALFSLQLQDQSQGNNTSLWLLGDGSTATGTTVQHQYTAPGTYTVALIARDTVCHTADTLEQVIHFKDTLVPPQVELAASDCGDGSIEVLVAQDEVRYGYEWLFEGQSFSGRRPKLVVQQPGYYEAYLRVTDSLCNRQYLDTLSLSIQNISRTTFLPSAFTPNNDGLNDEFEILGNRCSDSDLIRIFNRWGEMIFESQQPYREFWDGRQPNGPAPAGVYTYMIRTGHSIRRGSLTLIR